MWSATVCICEMGINGTNFGQKKVGMKETKENAKMNEQKKKIKLFDETGPQNPNQSFQNQPLPEFLVDSWSVPAAAAVGS